MEVNAFGEICNKNMLLMNKKSADIKTFNRNPKLFGFCYEIVEILLVYLTARL